MFILQGLHYIFYQFWRDIFSVLYADSQFKHMSLFRISAVSSLIVLIISWAGEQFFGKSTELFNVIMWWHTGSIAILVGSKAVDGKFPRTEPNNEPKSEPEPKNYGFKFGTPEDILREVNRQDHNYTYIEKPPIVLTEEPNPDEEILEPEKDTGTPADTEPYNPVTLTQDFGPEQEDEKNGPV